MSKPSLRKLGKTASIFVLCLVASTLSLWGQNGPQGKILGGYFEECKLLLYADQMTHLSINPI